MEKRKRLVGCGKYNKSEFSKFLLMEIEISSVYHTTTASEFLEQLLDDQTHTHINRQQRECIM